MTAPRYMTGSIFDSGADVLVNPVNCKGVHGKGLALEFKRRFPNVVKKFNRRCDYRLVAPGNAYTVFQTDGPGIMFFTTKEHWGNPSKLDWIRGGLRSLIDQVGEHGIPTIAVPALGCGCGGLAWDVVRPLIEDTASELEDYGCAVFLYAPSSTETSNRGTG